MTDPTIPLAPGVFVDTVNHWAKDSIVEVVGKGLFNGVDTTHFAPDAGMTRGMFVTVLGRLATAPQTGTSTFTDVPAEAYYAPYVAWAAEQKIVNGTSATTFSPEALITREQIAAMMVRYQTATGKVLTDNVEAVTFVDESKLSEYAADAVHQLQRQGLISGKPGNQFDPQGTATRAEVAVILQRFIQRNS